MAQFRGVAWSRARSIETMRRKSGTKCHQVHRNKEAKHSECSKVLLKAMGKAQSEQNQEKSFSGKKKERMKMKGNYYWEKVEKKFWES